VRRYLLDGGKTNATIKLTIELVQIGGSTNWVQYVHFLLLTSRSSNDLLIVISAFTPSQEGDLQRTACWYGARDSRFEREAESDQRPGPKDRRRSATIFLAFVASSS
jgi:hypothetical protein